MAERRRRWLGMRWWLAVAFALVAAVTAVAVVRVTDARSEDAFRHHAEEFAIGNSFAAAVRLGTLEDPAQIQTQLAAIAQSRRVSLYLFDETGRPITPRRSRGVAFDRVPEGKEALADALEGRRFVGGSADGSAIVVSLPLVSGDRGALVTYALRPDLRQQLGIFRNEAGRAALLAILIGAAAGLLLATFIARRLGRIAETARAIGAGDFDRPVGDFFPDEVGSLAESIDRMRVRLSELVSTLRQDRNQFEQLVERLHEGVLLVDEELRLEYGSARAYALLEGLRPGEQIGEALLGPAFVRFVRALVEERLAPDPLYHADAERTLEVSGVPSRARGDAAIVVVEDVTERERTERAQREFVTNAAHELRTPVAAIVTSIEMLQTGAKDDPEHRDEFLGHIEHQAARLTRLTRALLVLARAEARLEEPHREPVSLAPVLERVAADIEPQQRVTVAVECDADLRASADPELLEQALQSVARNAERHTESGTIVLRARRLEHGRVAVEVSDTGGGIGEVERARVFERFYRGNGSQNGFGLGLAIAAQSVRAIGGTIEIREDETGTTVEVQLPAEREVE